MTFLFVAIIVIPLIIFSVIIFINQNNPYKNAKLFAESETFRSYELPKFKLYLN